MKISLYHTQWSNSCQARKKNPQPESRRTVSIHFFRLDTASLQAVSAPTQTRLVYVSTPACCMRSYSALQQPCDLFHHPTEIQTASISTKTGENPETNGHQLRFFFQVLEREREGGEIELVPVQVQMNLQSPRRNKGLCSVTWSFY